MSHLGHQKEVKTHTLQGEVQLYTNTNKSTCPLWSHPVYLASHGPQSGKVRQWGIFHAKGHNS